MNFTVVEIFPLVVMYCFIFVFIIRLCILSNIFSYFKQEFPSYLLEFNPLCHSFMKTLASGKLLFFSISFLFKSEYALDDHLKSMRKWFIFFTFLQGLLFFNMLYFLFFY
jgi:hypothetical protein